MRIPSLVILAAGVTIAAVAVAGASVVRDRINAQREARLARTPLGESVPHVVLTAPDGREVSLQERIAGQPALLYVFGAAECAGCSQLGLEFTIVQRELPGLVPLLVASGSSAEVLLPSIRHTGLEDAALIDENRALLAGLGLEHEPLVLLVDATGRIVFVDHRSAPRASHYPMGAILRDLRMTFDASTIHAARSSSDPAQRHPTP